jgi:aryl-alcohol dehydrogenase-like predicted oxidoreductase
MEQVRLGGSGLHVSRVCLGMMSYGSSAWRPWVLDEEKAAPIARAAVEAGITFFDTALDGARQAHHQLGCLGVFESLRARQ